MSDEQATHAGGASHDAHPPVHLPPNSWAPINVALALSILFVGFLNDVRSTLGPAMWVAGLLYLIVACAFWVRGARREYLELPEDGDH